MTSYNKKKEYHAHFVANNGRTFTRTTFEHSNLRKAIKDIKARAKAEHIQQKGNITVVAVYNGEKEVYWATLSGLNKNFRAWKK